MKRNDFRKPLIQSGVILVFVILLISIVASSEGHGIIGSISTLISGFFSAVVFIIGLCFAIIISIAIIIGLFLAAVSIHSTDKARKLFDQLIATLRVFYDKLSSSASSTVSQTLKAAGKVQINPGNAHTAPPLDGKITEKVSQLEHDIKRLEAAIDDLQAISQKTFGQINALQDRLATLQDKDQLGEQLAVTERSQEKLSQHVSDLASRLEVHETHLRELEAYFTEGQDHIQTELNKLQEETSAQRVLPRILSYLESPEDRDALAEKAEEAVSKGMTYTESDDLFKSSLSPGIYKILAAHPRLTKDYLRSLKNDVE